MTVMKDNGKENSSRERVQHLFNKNVEMENNRRKAAKARIPSDPNAWQNMRENFEAIILEDHAFSEQHDIEYALWQLHYRRFDELRALFNAAVASSGTAASQNGKGSVLAGPDRLAKIRSQFKTFLSEATGFYHDLMLKIRAKYGLPLGYFSDDLDNQVPMSKDGNKSSEVKKGLMSCHRCLIYLGDLSRYKGLYGEGDSKARDFAAASSYYMEASSLWPSSGNPQHQLAILAGYTNDEFVSVYRYFRSLAVENPFVTARDNLIIAFEKNRQNYIQLIGEAATTKGKTSPRLPGKGKIKGETRPPSKAIKVEAIAVKERAPNNCEVLKTFVTRFVRLNGILFTRTSLETFSEVFSMAKNDLVELLSSGANEDFNFGSGFAECRLAVTRMIAILMFTVYNVSRESENQSYADILQRSVLLQNAFAATFEFMGCILERCNQLNDPSSSYLLPGIMIFVEWLACSHVVAVGSELQEKQVNARSFFWNKCVHFLNKLLSSGYAAVNADEEEAFFSGMSEYDESETTNRLALPEDFELRGFLPLIPSQLMLDFSRNHTFGFDTGKKEKIARVGRIISAGKALANIVQIGQEGVYFDTRLKKFLFGVEPQSFDDYSLPHHLEPDFSCSMPDISAGGNMVMNAASKTEVAVDVEDEDEVIVFKPFTNEKHMDEMLSKLSSSEIKKPAGEPDGIENGKGNGVFSVAQDSLLMQAVSNTGIKPVVTSTNDVANGISYPLQPVQIQSSTSKLPVERMSILNTLAQLNLMENGFLMKSELQNKLEVPQPSTLSHPYAQFVDSGTRQNYSDHIPQASVQFSGTSVDNLSAGSSSIIPQGLKRGIQ